MLGWVLRKGIEGATGASHPPAPLNPDDTQVELPDTPAPVFAARAIKRAVFGTPAPPRDETDNNAMKLDLDMNGANLPPKPGNYEPALSPSKPTGILLTPGTGTSRRKKVTFGHDVKANNSAENVLSGSRPRRRRTKLTEALENSRRNSKDDSKPERSQKPSHDPLEDDEWVEEVEGDEDEPMCDHDLTIDLNEPYSRSGRYWKASFEKYHGEAKEEMEKLVKYKQLAKSYAKMKDAEAMELRMKLKEEQNKISKMEKNIAEQASKLASQMVDGEAENPDMMRGLAKQTAMAVQYREQVKELEAMLREKEMEEGLDDELDTGRHNRHNKTHRKGAHNASPRTQKTLLETQRELRKARAQTRELGDVKERLERVEARSKRLDEDNKRLREDSTTARDLERQIKSLKADAERKAGEHDSLLTDYETLKENAKARHGEAQWVVQQRDVKIAELKRENRSLKTTSLDGGRMGGKRLDDALLAESARIVQELKSEIDLVGGSRKRSLAKKVDALGANMRSLGYQPGILFDGTETGDVGVTALAEQRERRLEEFVDAPNGRMGSPGKLDRPARTVKLTTTSAGTRVVSNGGGKHGKAAAAANDAAPRDTRKTSGGSSTSAAATPVATDDGNLSKLDALNARRQNRWRKFVPRDEVENPPMATIASLATGVAEVTEDLTCPFNENPINGEDDWKRRYELPPPVTFGAVPSPTLQREREREKERGGRGVNGSARQVDGGMDTEPATPLKMSGHKRSRSGNVAPAVMPVAEAEIPKIDLLSDRFARLGGTTPIAAAATWRSRGGVGGDGGGCSGGDSGCGNVGVLCAGVDQANSSVLYTSGPKSGLPPDRLSAALARIEQRKVERKRVLAAAGDGGKENVPP